MPGEAKVGQTLLYGGGVRVWLDLGGMGVGGKYKKVGSARLAEARREKTSVRRILLLRRRGWLAGRKEAQPEVR